MEQNFCIKCQNCKQMYRINTPADSGTYNVSCPYCNTLCSYTFQKSSDYAIPNATQYSLLNAQQTAPVNSSAAPSSAAPSSAAPSSTEVSPAVIAEKVRQLEKTCNVLWIILGVIQCITIYGAIAGVWNIVNSVTKLQKIPTFQQGNAETVTYFEQQKTGLIIMAIVNLVLGGVIGVGLILFEWYIRDYVLSHRNAFES